MERNFDGIWIPKSVWESKDLGWIEKLVLVEIDRLDKCVGCYASNQYFSDFFNLSKRRIIEIITSLIDKGYVEREIIYKTGTKEVEKRILRPIER